MQAATHARLFPLLALALALAAPARSQQQQAPSAAWPSALLSDVTANGRGREVAVAPDAPVRLYDAGRAAPAGDVDGDGAVDVVAGGCGAVHVVLGPVGASVALPRAVAEGRALRIDAPRCPCGATVTVESAGDVNCDGVGDVAVVCGASDGSSAAYVLLGRRRPAPWPSSLDDRGPRALVVALAGPVARVAAVGDVNGDNCTDVAVALRPSARSVRVVYGRPTAQWPPVLDVERLGPSEGFAVPGVATFAGVGDVDGDAVDDVVLGDGRGAAAFLVFGRLAFGPVVEVGSAEGVVAVVVAGFNATSDGDGDGLAVGAAGDVDGDGHADFVVCLGPSGDAPAPSRYLVVFGDSAARWSWPRFLPVGGAAGRLRWSLVSANERQWDYAPPMVSAGPAGDLNDDGVGDVVLCAQDRGAASRCTVVFGSVLPWPAHVAVPSKALLTLEVRGPAPYWPDTTRYVGPLGDIDGDGIDDLLLGAPEKPSGTGGVNVGSSFVVRGRNASSHFPAALTLSEGIELAGDGYVLLGGSNAPMAGASVSGVGDMDNDTVGDFAVGAPGAGRVYLVLGATGSNSEGAARVTIESGEEGDLLGWSVSSAGDVNGDRVPDLIAGAPGAAGGAGRAYVVFGRSGGWGAGAVLRVGALDGTSGFAIAGDAGAGGLGFAVSAAGDVNGDGIDDVLVGAVQTQLPLSASDVVATARRPLRIVGGRGYVLLGRRKWPRSVSVSLLAGTDGFAVDGVLSEPSASSMALSGVGDVDGDSYADFAVGSAYQTNGSNWTVHVVFGRASWGPSLNVSSLGGSTGFVVTASARTSMSLQSVSVARAGDVNGDGVADFVIGTANSGVHVLFGRKGKDAWPAVVVRTHEGAFWSTLPARNVRQVASADVNGDGLADVVCLSTTSPSRTARVLVVFGRRGRWPARVSEAAATSGVRGFEVVGGLRAMHLQGSVSSAGDCNGDGVEDLVIGTVEHRNGTGRAWVLYGSRAPRVGRSIQGSPGCCDARVGLRYAFAVPADAFVQDDGAELRLNASWSTTKDGPYRALSNDWLSFDSATRTLAGVPTHAGPVAIDVNATNARGVRVGQRFTLLLRGSLAVSNAGNDAVRFGGERSGETRLAPIVVDSTGSSVVVKIGYAVKSLFSKERSGPDAVVATAQGRWSVNGTAAGVNRLLARLVFTHRYSESTAYFWMTAHDDLGGSWSGEWTARRGAKDPDDPSSVHYYFWFLAVGLPCIVGGGVLVFAVIFAVAYVKALVQIRRERQDGQDGDDADVTENGN
eukprot:m51a1_g8292 hypothetical protein (1268) ;mRNA; r:162072-166320